MEQQYNKNPEMLHKALYANAPKRLAFDKNQGNPHWHAQVEEKLKELIGLPENPGGVPEIVVEWQKEGTGLAGTSFMETRFLMESEPGYWVPCHLLVPQNNLSATSAGGLFPVVVCLQGHSSGMHISLGRPGSGIDQEHIDGGRDFALQIEQEGYAALVLEQRAFGECEGNPGDAEGVGRCHVSAMQALLLGRTLVGERVHDVSRAIDALPALPAPLDAGRVACMGNSGGGTATWYAACLEKRLSIAMPSCAVCAYEGSIFAMYHCQCNFIPRALEWFEMEDLATLVAPRKLVVVAGREDDIFPYEYTKRSFDTIQSIYTAAGVPENCALVLGGGGHRFYPEEAWPVFGRLAGWKK